ncbi:phosphotransferase [Parvibaculum sedimenti]|uniref:Phosphotransferase n=1 Tax=Parvibaculum sedimenti TaxID=2608632 RepID=A0A6N6VLI7_9HYPH|nr:aminoglycoside phosphotransferase family protein [Parvibaculum sedimenti]KAB7742648.1 phosphotransferase [Parvibaculum sedimenti]
MFDQSTSDAFQAKIAEKLENLPSPPWRLVSEGLWGSVYDLGDGTVLKLTRRHGGLGTGESKIIREAAALRLLDGFSGPRLRAPKLIGQGLWDDPWGFGSTYSGPPLAGWLRCELMPGRHMEEAGFFGRASGDRDRFGEDLGAAIADFHRLTGSLVPDAAKLGDSLMRSLDEAMTRISAAEQRRKLDALKEAWRRDAPAPVFLHGDLNLSNVLEERRDGLAFIDFAEAGVGAPEADLRHFENAGPLRDAIFRGYAAASGASPNLPRYRLAVAVNAAVSLALGGESGHPREGLRRRQWLDEALAQAGID